MTTTLIDKVKSALLKIGSYFNVTEDLLPQYEAEADIRSSVSFKGSQLLILIFAIVVASLGLNTNSIPVIIGAMIISPLMGPIMGIGLGIGIQDFTLVKRSTRNILLAVIGSIMASSIYFLISPQYEGSSQLLARTSPSIYDVFIALFGGAAGIVSVTCKNKSSVMAGVAIATSLMPPLCTAGYGLATMQMNFFLGALYLFFTNAIFILFASWLGVKLFGYKKLATADTRKAKKVRWILYSLVILTISVSVLLTVAMIKKNVFMTKASEFVEKEFVFPNTQVFSHREYTEGNKNHIDINLIGASLPIDSLKLAMLAKLDKAGLGGTELNIKQGFGISSENNSSSNFDANLTQMMESELIRRQSTIDSLSYQLKTNTEFTDQSRVIAPEIKAIYPEIRWVALSRTIAVNASTNTVDTINIVFIDVPSGLSELQKQRLSNYLQIRLNKQQLDLIINPSSFPWPQINSLVQKVNLHNKD